MSAVLAPIRSATATVGLLTSPPELGSLSMDAYAGLLERSLRSLGEDWLHLESVRPPRSRFSALGTAPVAKRVWAHWRRYPSYLSYARRLDLDLNHVLDHAYGHLLYALDGARTVVTCHDIFPIKRQRGEIPGLRPRRVPPLTAELSLAGVRRAAEVIVATESTRDDLTAHFGVDCSRITVIPYGIHPQFRRLGEDELAAALPRAPFRCEAEHVILTIDTGAPYKNQAAMLEVGARVRRALGDVLLVHRGEAFGERELRRARELRMADSVVEVGRLGMEDLVLLYNRADVVLFPSYYEGFGWPVLEAMACGTPVVCSTATAVQEVAGGIAPTAEPDDHDRLAEHVARVLADRNEREALVGQGLERASRYTWEQTAAATAQVYRRVLESLT